MSHTKPLHVLFVWKSEQGCHQCRIPGQVRMKPTDITLATHPAVTAGTSNFQATSWPLYFMSHPPYQSSFTNMLIYLWPLVRDYWQSSFSAEGYMNVMFKKFTVSAMAFTCTLWFASSWWSRPFYICFPVTAGAALTKWHMAVKHQQDHRELQHRNM